MSWPPILSMPDTTEIVINTGPILALTAALGGLEQLQGLYKRVLVPEEVHAELKAAGPTAFGVQSFERATWLTMSPRKIKLDAMLEKVLDAGEAAVIQLALDETISTVCIDEAAGRRYARLYGLAVTGSLGVLLKARQQGRNIKMEQAIANMRQHGIWLSERLVTTVLRQEQIQGK